jgi:hypothetical protein
MDTYQTHEEYMRQAMLDADRVDMVNSPPHYTAGEIECIVALKAALGPEGFKAFCRGNVIKYNWRSKLKNGVEDTKKARWYIDRLIETEEE